MNLFLKKKKKKKVTIFPKLLQKTYNIIAIKIQLSKVSTHLEKQSFFV